MSRIQTEIDPKKAETFIVGKCIFSLKNNQLHDENGNYLALRSQAGTVLRCLVENSGHVVSKETLQGKVWGDAVVTDDSLVQCIGEIRKALNDKEHQLVETHPRKGYLINTGPVASVQSSTDAQADDVAVGKHWQKMSFAAGAVAALALVILAGFSLLDFDNDKGAGNDVPRIAVLPFDDVSTGEYKGYLSDAIAEGVLTDLARHRLFEVIAKNSSFKYRDGGTDVRQISDELGVHYVLEGSQQINEDDLRVTVRLVDAAKATNIWTNIYDVELGDLFIVQDTIVKTVADRVGEKIQRPIPGRDPGKVSALHYHLMGVQAIRAKFDAENNQKLIEWNELAIEADPNAHYGYLGLTFAYRHAAGTGWHGLAKKDALAKAFENGQKALELAPETADVHYALARLHATAGEPTEAALRFTKATELNPSDSDYLAASATPLLYIGKTDEAIDRLKRAMGIDPFHPDWYHHQMSWALWEKQDCTGALGSLNKMKQIPKGSYRMLTGIYACLGQVEKAKEAFKTYFTDSKELTISEEREQWLGVWTAEGSLERWLDHMRIAGMKD